MPGNDKVIQVRVTTHICSTLEKFKSTTHAMADTVRLVTDKGAPGLFQTWVRITSASNVTLY